MQPATLDEGRSLNNKELLRRGDSMDTRDDVPSSSGVEARCYHFGFRPDSPSEDCGLKLVYSGSITDGRATETRPNTCPPGLGLAPLPTGHPLKENRALRSTIFHEVRGRTDVRGGYATAR